MPPPAEIPGPPPYHAYPAGRVLEELRSGPEGLSPEEARARLALHGPNRLQEKGRESPLLLLARQFTDLLIVILAIAAFVSGILGEWLDAAAIIAIILLNGAIGFLQEYRAGKALEALKRMIAPVARVIRGGTEASIDARELVPGDIVLLAEGDRVPADGRLLETVALEADESALTGESMPVPKEADPICGPEEPCPGNMVYLGTAITRGRGRAVVTATGMSTDLGRIARVVAEEPAEATPLQRRLHLLGRQLSAAAIVIVAVIFTVGLAHGLPALGIFLVAVSLAVAAIPEGLPAVVTITLSLGVQRMAGKHAIIRRLSAVETLGAATVICTDKTGTLTLNEMTVRRVMVNGTFLRITGEGYATRGDFIDEGTGAAVPPLGIPGMAALLETGVLCNNAGLLPDDGTGKAGILGDPTEASLLVLAKKAGIGLERLRAAQPFAREIPFDSARKMMAVVRTTDGRGRAYVKGAPEVLVSRSTRILLNHAEQDLGPSERETLISATHQMASESLRVLGFAYRDLPGEGIPDTEVEQDLVFIGLAGMMDPPRPEARAAVRACREAGIRVVMITGDNPLTAVAVAGEVGLGSREPGGMLTGAELDRVSDAELRELVDRVGIYARVSPEHKLRIVDALRSRGEIVAMTGDGVNDAPALSRADIGVAMGIAGTEVAKEASDMVITDDNFASIERAVEEGRVIYANILKAVKYLLSCNVGELITIFVAIMAGLASPLTPIQILWMNLVTDSPPALALAMNPADPGVMKRPPRDPGERILSPRGAAGMTAVGLLMAAVVLSAFILYRNGGPGTAFRAGTMAFSIIILFQQFYALATGTFGDHHGARLPANPWLWAAFAFGLASQFLLTVWGPVQAIFDTVPLGPLDWGIVLLASSAGLFVPWAVRWIRWMRGTPPVPSP